MLKDEVTVTASKGRLRVEGPERAVEVAEGRTIKITSVCSAVQERILL